MIDNSVGCTQPSQNIVEAHESNKTRSDPCPGRRRTGGASPRGRPSAVGVLPRVKRRARGSCGCGARGHPQSKGRGAAESLTSPGGRSTGGATCARMHIPCALEPRRGSDESASNHALHIAPVKPALRPVATADSRREHQPAESPKRPPMQRAMTNSTYDGLMTKPAEAG